MNQKDPQQFPFYRLEREEIGARDYARLTFKEVLRVSRSVCRAYGVPQVKVTRRVMGRWAAEYSAGEGAGIITLNPKKGTATDLLTILHELAHHLHYHLSDAGYNEHQDHGPHFLACYMSILDTVRLIPYDAMATILKRRHLNYLLPGSTVKSLKRALRAKAPRIARARLPGGALALRIPGRRHGSTSRTPGPRRRSDDR